MQTPMVINGFENDLEMLFKPVEPNPAFVESLAVRLKSPKPVKLEKAGNTPLLLIITGSGLLAGVVVYILVRAIRTFFRKV